MAAAQGPVIYSEDAWGRRQRQRCGMEQTKQRRSTGRSPKLAADPSARLASQGGRKGRERVCESSGAPCMRRGQLGQSLREEGASARRRATAEPAHAQPQADRQAPQGQIGERATVAAMDTSRGSAALWAAGPQACRLMLKDEDGAFLNNLRQPEAILFEQMGRQRRRGSDQGLLLLWQVCRRLMWMVVQQQAGNLDRPAGPRKRQSGP